MKIVIFLLSFILLALAASDPFKHYENHQEKIGTWNTWKKTHNKTYTTVGEETARFAIFLESIKRIEKRNHDAQNPVYGLTKFSDLTTEEFKSIYLTGYRPKFSPTRHSLPTKKGAVPSTFDWRTKGKVTPVKDQGQCGSCWAFSVAENVESMWMIAKGLSGNQMSPLSPQEIVDCDSSDGGCSGGDPPTAYQYIMSAGGLETESDYPYTAENDDCSFDSSKVYATISNWGYATKNLNEAEMQTHLVNDGPLSICVDAETWSDYTGNVLMASDCGTDLDHCVLAVGYDTSATPGYWIVRNSWGSSWGESGYIRLQFGKDTCGLAMEATSAII